MTDFQVGDSVTFNRELNLEKHYGQVVEIINPKTVLVEWERPIARREFEFIDVLEKVEEE